MKNFINNIIFFAKNEAGAQVVEYALIIAVISIALVLGLRGLDENFATFITRLGNCLTGAAACAAGT